MFELRRLCFEFLAVFCAFTPLTVRNRAHSRVSCTKMHVFQRLELREEGVGAGFGGGVSWVCYSLGLGGVSGFIKQSEEETQFFLKKII